MERYGIIVISILLCPLFANVQCYMYVTFMNSICGAQSYVYSADELKLRPYMMEGMDKSCVVYMNAGDSDDETDTGVRLEILHFNVPCNEGRVKISNIQSGYVILCDESATGNSYKSMGDFATIEFIKSGNASFSTPSFDILITRVNNGWCRNDEFMCNNGDCIDKYGLLCDGNNNCGDNSDESSNTCLWTTGVIAGMSIGISSFVMIIGCFIFLALRRKRYSRLFYGDNQARVPIKNQMISQPYYIQPQQLPPQYQPQQQQPQYQPQQQPQPQYQAYAVPAPLYQPQDTYQKN